MKMTTKTFFYSVLCVLVMSLVSACGYHLRGNIELSDRLDGIYIQVDNKHAVMLGRLKNMLQQQGVQVVAKKDEARMVFHLLTDKVDKTTPVLNQSGKALEYELHYRISFSVSNIAGETLLETQHLVVNREYLFDAQSIMAKQDEERHLISAMQDEILYLILLRLQSL